MIVKAACEPGHRGEATPRRLSFDGRTVELTLVLDCWLGADHRYFKMRGDDGAIYILRHDTARDRWELTMSAAAAARP
ncbi:MAG: hypothetical protein ACREIR_24010 [Geminicoccaceae bacterium]